MHVVAVLTFYMVFVCALLMVACRVGTGEQQVPVSSTRAFVHQSYHCTCRDCCTTHKNEDAVGKFDLARVTEGVSHTLLEVATLLRRIVVVVQH